MTRFAKAGRLLGRHFLLEAAAVPGRVRFLSQAVTLAEGARQSWVTLTRVGNFSDPRYGNFSITPAMLSQMVDNFDKRVLGQDVFLDVSHRPSDGAAAKVLKLSVESGRLRAYVEWTDYGIQSVRERGFRYLSADYHEAFEDNETHQPHGCVLLGAGLTIRPVVKHLDPIQLSMEDDDDHDAPVRVAVSPSLLKELSSAQKGRDVNYLEQLKTKLLAHGLSNDVVVKLLAQAKAAIEAAADDQVKALAVVDAWDAIGKSAADQINAASATGGTVQLSVQDPAAIESAVAKALAARDTADEQNRNTLAGKHKLLSDTIQAGDATLTAEQVKELADETIGIITLSMPDDQVKMLAQNVVKAFQRVAAATKLSGMGYHINGDARITVDSSNTVKSLQATVDRRLGFEGMGDHERYAKTGGQLLPANKAFAEKALAHFDATNGHRLLQEHKQLAGGTTGTSDVSVPAIAERTVLREALYNLTSLNFVNVGTAPFAESILIPYSYRDKTAAGVEALRRYEGQGIRRAGVVQTAESAHPLPQKLAYLISQEIQLLLSASVIDFDPLAENIRNIIRIVGEDTEQINMNELVCSADEAGAATFTDTLTAQVDGTHSQFVTTKFPVVRERKVFDIRGNQIGNTVNPLVITLNSVVRSEYKLPADGSALAAGLYYVMDYNQGTFRFVDETGATAVPTAAWVLTVSGYYSTNAVTWNIDAVADEKPKERFDRLLTTIGGRKVVIGSDRYYQPNLLLMSAAVDNMVSQAETFSANSARVATGLASDGSLGTIKNMAVYNSTAPGLMLGDTRILVGERGNTRFRMVKPFAMDPPENARNTQGLFTAQKEGYGTQWVVSHTPSQLKNCLTSVILYSATGRVAA